MNTMKLKPHIILLLLVAIPLLFCGCFEIVQCIIVGADMKVTYKTEIHLTPVFFAKAFEREESKAKNVEAYRIQLLEAFKQRMKIFDTLPSVEEIVSSVTMKDSITIISTQIITGEPRFLHDINRLFWSGVASKPNVSLPSFPIDITSSKKADTLPVLEFSPIAARYQEIYHLTSDEIEDVDLYSRLFSDKMITVSFKAPQVVNIEGNQVKQTEDGTTWQFPTLDAILFGRLQYKPVRVMFVYMGDTAKYRYMRE